MIRRLWPLLMGFTVWALAFLAIYSLQALGCVWGWPAPMHRAVLVSSVGLTIALLVATLIWQSRTPSAEFRWAGLALTSAAIGASVITFGPVSFVTLCQ